MIVRVREVATVQSTPFLFFFFEVSKRCRSQKQKTPIDLCLVGGCDSDG